MKAPGWAAALIACAFLIAAGHAEDFEFDLSPEPEPDVSADTRLLDLIGERPSPDDGPHPHKITGFLDFNYYRDTRHFDTLTINAGAKLPHDFEYFQFTNFDSPVGQASEIGDWASFFTEIHLWRPIAKDSPCLKALDWSYMLADGTFDPSVHRFGVRWRTQDTPGCLGEFLTEVLKLRYAIDFHLVETDGSGIEIEHVFYREFFDKRFYIGGFADHDINKDGSHDLVMETQMGLRLCEHFYLVAEQRYNVFAPPGFRSGWGFGLEYEVIFE